VLRLPHDGIAVNEPSGRCPRTGTECGGLWQLMRHNNIPITRESYLELAYMGEVPAELSEEAPLRAFISGKRLASRVDRTKFRFPVGG
jgi:hypothetical protein